MLICMEVSCQIKQENHKSRREAVLLKEVKTAARQLPLFYVFQNMDMSFRRKPERKQVSLGEEKFV